MEARTKTGLMWALLFYYSSAQAIDGVSVERGVGDDSSINKIAVQESWDDLFLTDHDLRAYWEFNIASLRGDRCDDVPGKQQSVIDFGITPVVRRYSAGEQGVFGEIGIGANYMSALFNNDTRVMGTRFQFGDHLGVGYKFANRVEVTFKFQHYSNGGIKEPNPAVNFAVIKLAYWF